MAIPFALVTPLVLAAAAGAFVYFSHGWLPRLSYYELAAQIIPLLMIAFALENRATDFLSDPQMKLYRLQLFLFLLGGEMFALLGASGALRAADIPNWAFKEGYVVGHAGWSNVIAAGTTAGLVGGFAMLTVLALFWGPGWVFLSFRKSPREQEVRELREKLQELQQEVEDGAKR